MRDDDRIMREVQKIPEQTRREAQMTIREAGTGTSSAFRQTFDH